MKGHIHTDFMHVLVFALATAAVFHTMRAAGGALASKGLGGPGKIIGGIATFN